MLFDKEALQKFSGRPIPTGKKFSEMYSLLCESTYLIKRSLLDGIISGIKANIQCLMQNMGWDTQQAMQFLNIPEKKWQAFTELIQNNT